MSLTEYFKNKQRCVLDRDFRKLRRTVSFDASVFVGKSLCMRHALMLKQMCEAQEPIVLHDDVIAFARSDDRKVPEYVSHEDLFKIFGSDGKSHDILNNCCPNWEILLKQGLLGRLESVNNAMKFASNQEKDFLLAAKISIEAVLDLAKRYKNRAEEKGLHVLANSLDRVPKLAAKTFRDALQSLRFVSAMFYLSGNFQIGFGRMDQYLFPLYQSEIEKGTLTKEEALDLLKEFFLSLNRDTDLYPGVTVGDNGQSVVLGGCTKDGRSAINDLTYLIIEASRDLSLIDPKINLRINKSTPDDLLLLASSLTKQGLGFPQYLNDEVIIPGLKNYGYDDQDARDYAVAACWEFVIPGKGLDVVNQGAVSFPFAVDQAVRLLTKDTFNLKAFDQKIQESITEQTKNIMEHHNVEYLPAPFLSCFFDGCIENRKDVTEYAKYKNVGIHGAASASGADSYVVVQKLIECKDYVAFNNLRVKVANNFIGDEKLANKITQTEDKVGNDTPLANQALKKLFIMFSKACSDLSTPKKRIRPGSGSAQFYVWLAKTGSEFNFLVEPRVGATIDGRRDGFPFSSSLAPANEVKVRGILSVLRTYSNIDYGEIVNGGPITVEFAPQSLSSEAGLRKLVSLIRYFVELGDQELQLNVLNIETLQDALKHPERHKNLIVRVWGWSGYFCELPREFQEQIIARHRYGL